MNDVTLLDLNYGVHRGVELAIEKGFCNFHELPFLIAKPIIQNVDQLKFLKILNKTHKYFTHLPYFYGNSLNIFSIFQHFDDVISNFNIEHIFLQLYSFKETVMKMFNITLFIESFSVVKLQDTHIHHYYVNGKCFSLKTNVTPLVKLSHTKTNLDMTIDGINISALLHKYTSPGFSVKLFSDKNFICNLLLSNTEYAHTIALDILSDDYKKPHPTIQSKFKLYLYSRLQWKKFYKLKLDVLKILTHHNITSYDLVILDNRIKLISDLYFRKLKLYDYTLDSIQLDLNPWCVRFAIEETGFDNILQMPQVEKDYYMELFKFVVFNKNVKI